MKEKSVAKADVKNLQEFLIPWYANGTLSDVEQEKLEQLMREDERVRQLVAEDAVVAENVNQDILGLQDILQQKNSSLDSIKRQIAAQNFVEQDLVRKNKPEHKKPSQNLHTYMHQSWRRTYLIGAAAASVAFAVLIGVNFGVQQYQAQDFEVQSSIKPSVDPVMQIIFQPTISVQELHRLLGGDSLQIISGPSANGVYRIRLQDANSINEWQQNPAVLWAEIEIQ